MKKALIIGLIAAAMAAANVQAWELADTYNAMEPQEGMKPIKFRGLEWGASGEDVGYLLVTEGFTPDDVIIPEEPGPDALFVPYEVAGLQMLGGYAFDENQKLVIGMYSSMEKHSKAQLHYLDFLTLQNAITSVYGEMTLNDDQWITDVYKDSEDLYGQGVALGNMVLVRGWKDSEGAAIILSMEGDNGEVSVVVYYVAPGMEFGINADGL